MPFGPRLFLSGSPPPARAGGGHRRRDAQPADRVQVNVRVDVAVKRAVDSYCRPRGVAMNHFVQEALVNRLEELEDAEDLRNIRREPTRPLADVLRELGLNASL